MNLVNNAEIKDWWFRAILYTEYAIICCTFVVCIAAFITIPKETMFAPSAVFGLKHGVVISIFAVLLMCIASLLNALIRQLSEKKEMRLLLDKALLFAPHFIDEALTYRANAVNDLFELETNMRKVDNRDCPDGGLKSQISFQKSDFWALHSASSSLTNMRLKPKIGDYVTTNKEKPTVRTGGCKIQE